MFPLDPNHFHKVWIPRYVRKPYWRKYRNTPKLDPGYAAYCDKQSYK